MCGILGFLGFNGCFKYGIYGLRQLQNRGYDSAGGCGIKKNNDGSYTLILRKYATTPGSDSIDMLESKDNVDIFADCASGIFHTRWATHGAKTDTNAHPHVDYKNRIALVHNGIIENYYELKSELEKDYGIQFKSETDTEVIVNLISVYYDQSTDNNGIKHMEDAMMKAISRLQGTWALVVISIDKPDNMYCARHGSPLLVGFGGSYIIVTSEQAGFGPYVNNYICLNNGDLTVIRKRNNKVTFENVTNYELRKITIKNNELTPEPFPHWTIKEIHEQYEASIRAISFGGRIIENNKVKLGGPMAYKETLLEMEHLILLGCGTSLNAAQHSIGFFTDLCNFTTVQAFDGSEFISDNIPRHGKVCAVFLSQSGETKDLYRCIKICRDNNIFTIGVINVVDSLIAREVDCGCYLNAGREVGVASTKAFTSQVIVLSMLAIFFAQIHNLSKHKRDQYIKALRQLPSDIKKAITESEDVCKDIANYLVNQRDLFVLGKGSMISVASEGALKTKEIGYIHSEAYGGNALRHGPYAVIESGTPIVFLCPNDNNFSLMNNTIEEVKSRDAYPIIISDTENVSRHAAQKVIIPNNSIYKGILHNIPMQLIAYHMACKKGHNPDMPKNLSKCDKEWTHKQRSFLRNYTISKRFNDNPCEIYGLEKLSKCDLINSVSCLAPHGPTLYSVISYGCSLKQMFAIERSSVCMASSLRKVPFVNLLASMIYEIIDVEPVLFQEKLQTTTDPVVIYSGGFQDVFRNCLHPENLSIMVNSKSRFYKIVRETKKKIIPILILNELDNYNHPQFVTRLFRYVHKRFFRCGIPIPPLGSFCIPLFSLQKTIMICGEPIDSTLVDSDQELCQKYIDEIKKIHCEAQSIWKNVKPLSIIDYSE